MYSASPGRPRARTALVLLAALVASVLTATLTPGTASAALPVVHVVDPGGDDNGPGTDAQPWRSFGTALARIQPGTILLVRNGDYQGPFFINKQATAQAPILVAAYPGHRPVLRTGEWQGLGVHDSAYVHVRGFEVIGHAATGQGYDVGLEAKNSHHIRFDINVVHDTSGGGISGIHSDHLSIENNEVYNTSRWAPQQTSAISLWQLSNIGGGANPDGYSNYINANYVHDNENRVGERSDGNCIIIDSNVDTGYSAHTLITNNVCRGNGGRGIHVYRSSNVAVINNTAFGDAHNLGVVGGGELSAIDASNVLFRNNLVAPAVTGGGIMVYQSTGIVTDHNAFVDVRAVPLGPGDQLVPGLPRMFGLFPPIDGPTSDAGNPDHAPVLDFLMRPRSGPPDIGAFELR